MSPRVILASASPRRRELLAALIDGFAVVPSDVDELLTGDGFVDAERLAFAKAQDIARKNPGAIVIGSDTVVFDEDRSFGKPADQIDAMDMWRHLRGRVHEVATSVALVGASGERQLTEVAEVELAALSDVEIHAYVASGRPMDKAGAYAIQDEDIPTVAALQGCYCAVMGLPLWITRGLLEDAGVPCRDPSVAFPRCAACPSRPDGG
ncbi:Maf family protein [Candidatus Amarobacter glycogenicus]|uniref:Maf family protein n=1 Tax=Candidatus Amarobacter glycogenicus TaxID=3140699 RepID=UPI0031364F7C|nr:septum formation protein Maf [Dehalococcoidia bacterium]